MTNSGLSAARLASMRSIMSRHVDRGDMPGMVYAISRRGTTHVEVIGNATLDGTQPMQRDTIFRIASLTKPIIAAAAMILVEECAIRLDDAIDRWLPELTSRRVLRTLASELDDTVPARRAITLRDLLTFRLGFGSVMAPPGTYPIQKAIRDLKIGGDGPPDFANLPRADDWLKSLGSLPLIHQPGERWMYNTGADVLGLLIERVARKSLEDFLRERLFAPLNMRDTAFSVAKEKAHRLPGCYVRNPDTGRLDVFEAAGVASALSKPVPFCSGAGGLTSTVDDYVAFCQMLLDKGRAGDQRILSRAAVELMTSDQLTAAERADAQIFFGHHSSWGFGLAVGIHRGNLWATPGRFGWDGGLGLSAYTDPTESLIGVLMTQKLVDSPEPPPVYTDFWTGAYRSIDD